MWMKRKMLSPFILAGTALDHTLLVFLSAHPTAHGGVQLNPK